MDTYIKKNFKEKKILNTNKNQDFFYFTINNNFFLNLS